MRAATEGSLPPVMPQGNLVEVLGREVRQGSPGELMVESTPSRQRRPPCKTNKEESDEAADAAALTYLLTYSVEDHLRMSITQPASNLHSDEDIEDKIKLLNPRVQTLIRTYLEAFGELPPPASCDKLVQMDLKLKPELVGHKMRRRPYPAPKEQADEIERQIQECIDAGLVLEYKDGDYPQHCSPCFLVAKPGSTAKRLVVDYGELNKKMLNH